MAYSRIFQGDEKGAEMVGVSHPDKVRIDWVDGIVTASVTGELDIGTVEHCLGGIDGQHPNGETKVVLDLQALTSSTSPGYERW